MQERIVRRDLSCFACPHSRKNKPGIFLLSLYGTDSIDDAQDAEQSCICCFSHRCLNHLSICIAETGEPFCNLYQLRPRPSSWWGTKACYAVNHSGITTLGLQRSHEKIGVNLSHNVLCEGPPERRSRVGNREVQLVGSLSTAG